MIKQAFQVDHHNEQWVAATEQAANDRTVTAGVGVSCDDKRDDWPTT